MPPLNLYARVRFLMHTFAHETAGAARIRHSLLPRFSRDNDMQTSGKSCRENADVHLLFGPAVVSEVRGHPDTRLGPATQVTRP